MEHATLIVLLALLQYVWFTIRVGSSRGKYHVDAPACEGDEAWQRMFRVQQNTMEQLIVMIPAAYAFAYYVSELWVLLPGIVFHHWTFHVLGRIFERSKDTCTGDEFDADG